MSRGNFYGSGIVGAVDYFIRRWGNAAAGALVAKLQPTHPGLVVPNAARLGLLGAKLYSYAFVGDLVRAMIAVVRPTDEDAFIREVVSAGMDETLSTVNRVLLRYVVTPEDHAKRAQQLWSAYHDSGTVNVLSSGKGEYVVEVSDWPNHDVMVCRICMEARRRILEKTGVGAVEAARTRCIAWGHDTCVARYRWTVKADAKDEGK
ncbi:MAG: hypothetical protein ABI175_20480 [Polyangiales bacterium]